MFARIGKKFREFVMRIGYVFGYIGRVMLSSMFFFKREKAAFKILVMQLYFTFVQALPLTVIMSLGLSSAIYLFGYSFLLSMGQTSLIYKLLVIIVMRELGPLLVAFMVTARSSTAIAIEIAGMVISHQIESYISVGIDPVGHLVAPRFIAVTISVFMLNLYFSLCGLLGPMLVSLILNPSNSYGYLDGIFNAVSMSTIFVSCIKSLLFGMVISISSTFYGFNVERASTEIPVAGINAVGKGFAGILLVDIFVIVLSLLF